MKLNRLLLSIVGAFLLCASAAQAQFRAVAFDGATFLFNNGGVATVAQSYGGTASYWYCSSFPTTAGIMEVSASSNTNAPGLEVMHQYFAGEGIRFVLYLSPAGQGGANPWDPASSMRMVGDMQLPYDGACHNIMVTWDTRGFVADWGFDGELRDWDLNLTKIDSQINPQLRQAFRVKYANQDQNPNQGNPARWFVGAVPSGGSAPFVSLFFNSKFGLFLSPVYFRYVGVLAELYLHIGDDDYTEIHNMQLGSGFGERISVNGVNVAKPLELGEGCAIIFGIAGGLPELCMRGDADNFPLNQGGDTAFQVQGTLKTAPIDPFVAWTLP